MAITDSTGVHHCSAGVCVGLYVFVGGPMVVAHEGLGEARRLRRLCRLLLPGPLRRLPLCRHRREARARLMRGTMKRCGHEEQLKACS